MNHISIVFPVSTQERLRMTSRVERKSVSELVRELVDTALEAREKARLRQMYQGLRTLQGIGSAEITDASTTIDAVLYGANGVWKGNDVQ